MKIQKMLHVCSTQSGAASCREQLITYHGPSFGDGGGRLTKVVIGNFHHIISVCQSVGRGEFIVATEWRCFLTAAVHVQVKETQST